MLFTDCLVGWPGSVHDARVFSNSKLYRRMQNEDQDLIPPDSFIVADSVYPLLNWGLTSFKHSQNLTAQQRKYNMYLSYARVAIEMAFALLKRRWRRLKFLDMDDIQEAPTVCIASCVFHICILLEEDFDKLLQEGRGGENDVPNIAAAAEGVGGAERRNALVDFVRQLP